MNEMKPNDVRPLLDRVGLTDAEILRLVRFPEGELLGFKVVKKEAVQVWRALREQTEVSGLYPVVVGESVSPAFLEDVDATNEDESVREILRSSAAINLEDWIQRELEMDPEHFEVDEGDWTSADPESSEFYVLEKGTSEGVVFGLVPTRNSFEIPAFLRFGGWNSCPSADVQVAAFHAWADRFGAEIFAVTKDTIECFVSRPPQTKEAAQALAWEQYVFCTDIVDQGTQTLNGLASVLINSPRWFFWWD